MYIKHISDLYRKHQEYVEEWAIVPKRENALKTLKKNFSVEF